VNLELGYKPWQIYSPREVTKTEGDQLMHEREIRAVEMVRSIRDAHYERLKDLSPREKIAFFREKARALHADLGKPEGRRS
jgi:hypothetical protein